MKPAQSYKIIVSGGGTGGHIFPAIAIANELKQRNPENEFLFVGAEDRMEMERVPKAGYNIVGLPVAGFKRKLTPANFIVILKLLKSLLKARKVIRTFKPHIAIGVGGYASGPTLRIAAKKNIPTLIQEQNSYAGVTNRLLAKKAAKICVAYDNMEKYFPKEKITLTGNPIRQDLSTIKTGTAQARAFFKIDNQNPIVLILGGSLGARTLNNTMIHNLEKIQNNGITYIWQTGKLYIDEAKKEADKYQAGNIIVTDFISRMDYAYAAANVIISRAGAGTISELCVIGKPCILVPSPNVSEDHQTKNAMALVNKNAAVMVKDAEAEKHLLDRTKEVLDDSELQAQLSKNIKELALPKAAQHIADEIYKILEKA
jgi:UDP-N-acetylglucosamine--N-acetylmuramyl-(pentapeptide) pyrophosphoryl-undecaprenol N-acetylglucosamine transferase